jgi:hypothetical protein
LTARLIALVLAVREDATGQEVESATAASTVAFQVRKSLAVPSPPVWSLIQALMSSDRRSTQAPFSR